MDKNLSQTKFKKLETRKGARRSSEIKNEVLDALNQGKIESINLVEWLAIDMPTLLHYVLTEIGLENQVQTLYHQAIKLKNEGVMKRLKGIGELLFESFENYENRLAIFETLVNHPSDMVRGWMAFYIAANHHLYFSDRLEMMRRFAEDSSMSVRECAWASFRPYLVEDLTTSFQLLIPWVKDKNPNIRRCAVEATRPRGVWCKHIPTLKENPEHGLTILEFVRSDSSKYVQRSVGNWLNDASKSRPDWVINTCMRWQEESPTQETNWIIKHGLRTINKKAIQ
ncbi:MAG: DNA alkylation repair protein [Symploca sp. SIO1C2]|nr:DNA alkylation repair protein [Symploca sp. SIO1C2]